MAKVNLEDTVGEMRPVVPVHGENKMMFSRSLVLVVALGFAPLALAQSSGQARTGGQQQGVDNASKEALEKTQNLLRSSGQRKEAIKAGGAQMQEADSAAAGLAGNEANKERMYDISADVFDKIVKDANGDPTKMKEALLKAQGNPEAFLRSLSPQQQAAIKQLADQIGAQQGQGAGHQPAGATGGRR